MKNIILITTFVSLAFSNLSYGQFTQVELFTGLDKTDFTLYSSYAINKSETLSLNTLAFFQKFKSEANKEFDEIGVQPTLFWNINKHIAIGPSIYYNSFAGFAERLSAKLTLKNSRILFVTIPTMAYSEQKDASYAELLVQLQYNIPLSNKVSLWCNGQLLTIWDEFEKHSRSFQQLRIGIEINTHQFGLGLDIDQYGPKPIEQSSFGLYYRNTL
ncbi:hypothetical protein [Gaetbulibacter jejuensis]|uniref:Uncharacterized protein n=1 Tax=Gaetbulibacter jejuensis TaxID=584607 RepID=A0ABP3UVU9_9FLAO